MGFKISKYNIYYTNTRILHCTCILFKSYTRDRRLIRKFSTNNFLLIFSIISLEHAPEDSSFFTTVDNTPDVTIEMAICAADTLEIMEHAKIEKYHTIIGTYVYIFHFVCYDLITLQQSVNATCVEFKYNMI